MAKESLRGATLYERSIVTKTRLLKDVSEKGFAEQIQVTVAVALMVDSAAMNSGIAVRVLSLLLTGRVGDTQACTKIQNRLQGGSEFNPTRTPTGLSRPDCDPLTSAFVCVLARPHGSFVLEQSPT